MAVRRLKRTGWKWVCVGWVEDADDPYVVVLELVARDSSPVVGLFPGVRFVVLDAGSPHVHEGSEGGGHPTLPREEV